jgi:hypothetical protein
LWLVENRRAYIGGEEEGWRADDAGNPSLFFADLLIIKQNL